MGASDIFEEVRMHQLAQVFDHKLRLYIVFEALCGSSMDTKKVEEHQKVIALFISNANMSGGDVLWALNTYIAANPSATKGLAKHSFSTIRASFQQVLSL